MNVSKRSKPELVSPACPPKTWLLLGDKLGDNAQIEPIAAALGWPCERKHLRFKKRYGTYRPLFRASISHVASYGSDQLAPPWPDLILTTGRRPASVALWIREKSGGRTKLVIVGRP